MAFLRQTAFCAWLVTFTGCSVVLGVHDIPEDSGEAGDAGDASSTDVFVTSDVSNGDASQSSADGPHEGASQEGASQGPEGGEGGDAQAPCSTTTCSTGCCGTDGQCHTEESASECGTGGGSCNTCSASQTCSAGTCAAKCTSANCPTGCCDATGTCVTDTTDTSCGTDGAACGPCTGTNHCENGSCGCATSADCPALQACDATTHACTGTCNSQQTCNGGCCDSTTGQCTDGSANSADCGDSGSACVACAQPTPTCAAGQCSCTGTTCGSTCTSLQTDPNNCGKCGTVCPSGSCSGGTCQAPTCNGTCGETGCTDFTCIAEAPSGWIGPFQLWQGAPSQEPACPSPTTDQIFTGNLTVNEQAAECSACTCGAASFSDCGTEVAVHSDAACSVDDGGGGLFSNNVGQPDYCYESFGYKSIDFSQGPVPGSSATPSTQTPTIPPVTWSAAGVGCSQPFPQAMGCSAGSVCAPIPSAPFATKLCIYQSGSVSCPAQTFVEATTFYSSATDTRACSSCLCDTCSGGSCTGTAAVYSSTNCSGAPIFTTTNFSTACQPTGLTTTTGSASLINVSYSGTPVCTPSGGQATGTITPSGPITVCCTP